MLVQILFIGIFGNQEITVFGLTSNIGNLFYASVVFGMCLMMEIYGVEEARRTRNVLAGCVLAASLLGVVPVGSQILIASLAAFLAAQTVFIHLWERFRSRTIFLYNVGSSIATQAVDSIVFFPIAFVGIRTVEQMTGYALDGFLLKSLFAFVALPFYLGMVGLRKFNVVRKWSCTQCSHSKVCQDKAKYGGKT